MATALCIATIAVGSLAEELPRLADADSRESSHSKTLLIVRTPDDAEFAERIRTELQATDWRIVEVDGTELRAGPEALAPLAAELGANAAVRVDVKSGKVDVFIVRASGSIAEALQSEPKPFNAQVLALRTTEALRARGLELGTAPTAAGSSSGAQEGLRDADRRQGATRGQRDAVPLKEQPDFRTTKPTGERALVIEAAPAIIGSPGGLGLSVAAWLDLRLELSSMLALSAMGALPVNAHRVSGAQGEADVSTRVLGMAGEVTWLYRPLVAAATGFGAAAFVTSMKGTQAQLGYAVANEWVTTGGPFAYFRVNFGHFGDTVRLFAMGLGGLSMPEVRVAFSDTQVAHWGQPFGLLAMGIDGQCLSW